MVITKIIFITFLLPIDIFNMMSWCQMLSYFWNGHTIIFWLMQFNRIKYDKFQLNCSPSVLLQKLTQWHCDGQQLENGSDIVSALKEQIISLVT